MPAGATQARLVALLVVTKLFVAASRFARAAGWHATPTPHTLQPHTRRGGALWQRGRRGRTLVQAAAIGVVHEGHKLAPFVH